MKLTPIAASVVFTQLGFIATAFMPITVQAANFDIDSHVSQVLVYPDQAWIQRQAQIDLPQGTHELYFRNFSRHSNLQSVSFSATGTAGMQILNQGVETQDVQRYPSPGLKDLRQQRDAQQLALDEINDEISVVESQLELLVSMQKGIAQANQALSVQELEQMQTYSRQSYTQLHKEQRELSLRRQEQEEKLAAIQADYDDLLAQQGQESYAYRVTVQVDQAGPQTLDLSYYSWGASWAPSYQLHYDTQTHALSLDYAARVSQQTAEDWRDIKIAFSTGRPMQVGVVPEISPQFIRFKPDPNLVYERSVNMARGSMAMSAAPAVVAEMQADSAIKTEQARRPQAQVESASVASTFTITSKVVIPSGSQQQTVHISRSEQTVKPEYAYYPGFWNDKVLMTVEGKNTLDYPLLPGDLLSFSDGKLVGSGNLPMLLPEQSFKQMLGEDQTIIAKREPIKRFEENSGIINKSKIIHTDNSYSLSNQRQEPVEVTVYDLIPSSQHEDIKVKMLEPKNQKLDEFGRYQQVVALKPQEKQLIKQSYTVEYPSDKEIMDEY